MDRIVGEMTPEQKAMWEQYIRAAGLDKVLAEKIAREQKSQTK